MLRIADRISSGICSCYHNIQCAGFLNAVEAQSRARCIGYGFSVAGGGIFYDGSTVSCGCRTGCDRQIGIGLNEKLVISGHGRGARTAVFIGKCRHSGCRVFCCGLYCTGAGGCISDLGATVLCHKFNGCSKGFQTCHCIQKICPFRLGKRYGSVGCACRPCTSREGHIYGGAVFDGHIVGIRCVIHGRIQGERNRCRISRNSTATIENSAAQRFGRHRAGSAVDLVRLFPCPCFHRIGRICGQRG